MILYCFITYLVMLGALIDSHDSIDTVSFKEWMCLLFSPVVLPVLIGMIIFNKDK